MLPFQRESVCKGKAFFLSLQIFSKVFFRKSFSGWPRGAYPFLAPLRPCKVRYSGAAPLKVCLSSPVCHSQRLSLSKAVAKVRTFSAPATFITLFFSKIFEDFYKSLEKNVLQDMFFRRLRKRMGTCLHYVFRAGASERTYMYTKKKNMYAQNLQLHTRRNRLNNRHATGKTGGDTEESIHTWAAFFQRAEKKLKRIRFWPPQKIHGLPDLFPGNSHFYASRRTETSQELPILCHPKDKNFPDMTIFMPIGRRKKINLTTFFFAPLRNPNRNSFPERQEIPKYLRKNWKRSYIFTT